MKTLLIFLVLTVLSSCLKSRGELTPSEGTPPTGEVVIQPKEVATQPTDELRQEIQRMSSRIEDLEKQNAELKSQNSKPEEVKKLETRIQELETAQMQMIEALKKAPQTPKDLTGSIQGAKESFKSKNYKETISFINQYMSDVKGSQKEEALWMRGESYYAIGEFKKAILDYSALHESFPKSPKAPQAVYKTAMGFKSLGMNEDAKVFFQELVEKYPKSSEAKLTIKKHLY
jgi:TolA-binding protein